MFEKLFVVLECFLDDKVDRVKLVVVIILFLLNRLCEKVDIFIYKFYLIKYKLYFSWNYLNFFEFDFFIINFLIG